MYHKVLLHRIMLADKIRMKAYKKSIIEVVKKGDIVADIGTGSGILAFLAVQAGARKVYAIDHDDIIREAEDLAKSNRLDDKIVFIKAKIEGVRLPEPVDVIISELIGVFGLEENMLWLQIAARRKFLKPKGRLIPSWLELYFVPVESKSLRQEYIDFWDKDFYGLDFSLVRHDAVSQRYISACSGKVRPLANPSLLSHIDFFGIEVVPHSFKSESAITERGYLHGFVGYFKAGLSKNTVLSTAPEDQATHWSQSFFPIEAVVKVEPGDEVECRLKAIARKNGFFWEWNTSVARKGKAIADFSQSNLYFSRAEITRRKRMKP